MNIQGLIIDPQIDFCYPGLDKLGVDTQSPAWLAMEPLLRSALGPSLDRIINKGELYVEGAYEDMCRLAKMIDRIGDRVDDIHITLDSHLIVDQAHPKWWKRMSDGKTCDPFTMLRLVNDRIVKVDLATGQPTNEEYTTYLPSWAYQGGATGGGSKGYLRELQAQGKYDHMVWPEHCLIGSQGHAIIPVLWDALARWQRDQFAQIDVVTKGSNSFTEHYSGIKAEVVHPEDHTTALNERLIETLETSDEIWIAGEGLSHCLANTVRDIATAFGDDRYVRKLVLIRDCTSNVAGFESYGDQFIQDMTARGMRIAYSDTYLS